MVIVPAVIASNHALSGIDPGATQVIEIPRQQIIGGVGQRPVNVLIPNWAVFSIHLRVWIRETTYAGHGAKVGVEGAVLLHEEDDMLDIGKGTRTRPCGEDAEAGVERRKR